MILAFSFNAKKILRYFSKDFDDMN